MKVAQRGSAIYATNFYCFWWLGRVYLADKMGLSHDLK